MSWLDSTTTRVPPRRRRGARRGRTRGLHSSRRVGKAVQAEHIRLTPPVLKLFGFKLFNALKVKLPFHQTSWFQNVQPAPPYSAAGDEAAKEETADVAQQPLRSSGGPERSARMRQRAVGTSGLCAISHRVWCLWCVTVFQLSQEKTRGVFFSQSPRGSRSTTPVVGVIPLD